jgi:hypothetical protein
MQPDGGWDVVASDRRAVIVASLCLTLATTSAPPPFGRQAAAGVGDRRGLPG